MNLFVVGVELLFAWWFTIAVRRCYIMGVALDVSLGLCFVVRRFG